MVVGHIDSQQLVSYVRCIRTQKVSNVNNNTKTFYLESAMQEIVPNFKRFYSELASIGRHFVIYHEASPRIKRQYTICNAMVPEIYSQLIELAETREMPDGLEKLLDSTATKGIYITAKNYKSKTGVATRLHEVGNLFENSNFVVKGPMGKGCNIKPTGVHVVFTAGTGILVYLDIVARLILQNSGNLPKNAERFQKSFSLHLFASFKDRKEAIGLDMCEALLAMN